MSPEDGASAARSAPPGFNTNLAADVRIGLGGRGPKTLPSHYLYDELGSALYESICLLPEYGLTRADERILRRYSADIGATLAAQKPPGVDGGRSSEPPVAVVELGSGSGKKTRWLLEALVGHRPLDYFPIDLSSALLERCRLEIGQLRGVRVTPIEAEYLDGLRRVNAHRPPGVRLLLLFLGSTIGNFDRPAGDLFLRAVRGALRPGDALLLGTDLVKPVPLLLAAYDDPLGVTAAFDLNLLVRINRELDADFEPRLFEHQARWNEVERRVEMHLVARQPLAVVIRAIDLTVLFHAGESIWTESSHKYRAEEALDMVEAAGFERAGQWVDSEWPFAESLFVAR